MRVNDSLLIRFTMTTVICMYGASLQADPPDRVARLSRIEGNMSFLPAGSNEWQDATRNRPLITGDRLWNDTNTYSQLQLGNAKLCVGPNTNLNVVNLSNTMAQFQLTEGSLNLDVKTLANNQAYEIDTPNLAFTVQKPGNYQIMVDQNGDATIVQISQGQGEVYGEGNAYLINSDQAYRFTGTSLQYDAGFQSLPPNEFNQWCNANKIKAVPQATRYVSQDVIGYEDLETAGTWETIPDYGPAWSPNNIDANWAPYRDGHWAWIEPWGWSWVGEEEWGFAPYHYGRWVHQNKWYWLPYSDNGNAVYAPALVAFIGAVAGYQLAVNQGANVAWFPLGPGDIYWPSYQVSYKYFRNVNHGQYHNQRQLQRAYRNPNMPFNYRNRNVNNGITAVNRDTFIRSQNVNKAMVRLNAQQIEKLPARHNIALQPKRGNIQGARVKPSEKVISRETIAKTRAPATKKGQPSLSNDQLRYVKPAKPRNISKQDNPATPQITKPINPATPRDINRPINPQKPRDINRPPTDRRPQTDDSSTPERFRKAMPEYPQQIKEGPSQREPRQPRFNREQQVPQQAPKREPRQPRFNQEEQRQREPRQPRFNSEQQVPQQAPKREPRQPRFNQEQPRDPRQPRFNRDQQIPQQAPKREPRQPRFNQEQQVPQQPRQPRFDRGEQQMQRELRQPRIERQQPAIQPQPRIERQQPVIQPRVNIAPQATPPTQPPPSTGPMPRAPREPRQP